MDEVDGYFLKDIVVHFFNLGKQNDKSIDFSLLSIRHRSRQNNVLALFQFANSICSSFLSLFHECQED